MSCFFGVGVGTRVALARFARLGVGVLLIEVVRNLGVGIRVGAPLLGGLGVLAPRTNEVNFAGFTVLSLDGESETSDGAVTALCIRRFSIFGWDNLLAFCGDCSAEADLVSLGAKMAHLGGEAVGCFPTQTKECSCVLEDDEEEDVV